MVERTLLIEELEIAVTARGKGIKATVEMIGRKGGSFHVGERGVGHQNLGDTSAYLLLKNIFETVKSF